MGQTGKDAALAQESRIIAALVGDQRVAQDLQRSALARCRHRGAGLSSRVHGNAVRRAMSSRRPSSAIGATHPRKSARSPAIGPTRGYDDFVVSDRFRRNSLTLSDDSLLPTSLTLHLAGESMPTRPARVRRARVAPFI